MATFVHLTAERNLKSILRNGITLLTRRGNNVRGVYCSPVTPNYYATHQWLRELKRWKRGPGQMVAIYFRIPDDDMVSVGRYNEEHLQMTAAQAIARVMQRDYIGGYEVIIPRKIVKDEILRVKSAPQVIGWRYWPESKGNEPWCAKRGEYGARKVRAFFNHYGEGNFEEEDDLENDHQSPSDEEL